jgi:hypothetical protein
MASVTLTLTQAQHGALRSHLFPADGCEAVALILCARRAGKNRHRLLARRVVPVPYADCRLRRPDRVVWSTDLLPPLLDEAEKKGWALVKIHGHLSFPSFSTTDDEADAALFPSVHGWMAGEAPHASAIMMADGSVFGRAYWGDGRVEPLALVNVVGHDLKYWFEAAPDDAVPEFGRRVAQSFGKGTYDLFRKLKIGVVGISGTGSPVIEQLARNSVGALVVIDPDTVEEKNLNRILNATRKDSLEALPKVQLARRTIEALGFGTQVETFQQTLFTKQAVAALADCDILFGCMDSVDGRHLLNKLASFYLIPYFDLGVKIEADGKGGVDQVCGTVHYLVPDGSSLLSRHVYSTEQVRAAGLARTNPDAYRDLLAEGYIKGVQEDRPAVIQLNMLIASLAVNELMARIHPYRLEPNADYAAHRISLSHGIFAHERDDDPCPALSRHAGRGDVSPLLDWPELGTPAGEAQ